MNEPEPLLTLAVADLQTVQGELPAETAARLQVLLDECRYDRVSLSRDGHEPPFELSRFDVAQIEAAVERLPGTEEERRAERDAAPPAPEEQPEPGVCSVAIVGT